MGVYDHIKAAFQDIIAPDLHALRDDIRVLDQKLDGVDARLTIRIDAFRTELTAEIRRVDTRIDGVNTWTEGVDARIGGLDRQLRTAMDIRERLAALEARRSP